MSSSHRHPALTRRAFVKSTAALSALPFAASALGRSNSTDTLKIGLVGCGGRGTGAIVEALRADPNVVLTAMGDVFGDRVRACLNHIRTQDDIADRIRVDEAHLFSGFENCEQVVDSGIDVLVHATPPVFRPAHLRYAVNAGKHVFTEKPMAVDAPGIRSVQRTTEVARRNNLALVAGFCWRYHIAQRALFEQIHNGRLGAIRAMETTYNTGPLQDVPRQDGWSDMEWQLRNWKAFIWASGDHIVEQAVHAIDWINWAMNGEVPARATAVGGRQCRTGKWTGNMYDHFSVTYEYASGTRAYHMCRQIAGCTNDNTAHILGTRGTCHDVPWTPDQIRIEGDDPWQYAGESNNMYQTEHDELFASIRRGAPINDGVWMCNSTMMAIMARMCAYTGQTLTWEQCMKSEENLTPDTWEWGARDFPAVPMPGQTPFV
jgi:myo-inositol 2-dehydrogenase/D-chiro-inositol 1-dehydrogenase